MRPNGEIVSYTVYQRDPALLATLSVSLGQEDSAFSGRSTTLQDLKPHHRSDTHTLTYQDAQTADKPRHTHTLTDTPPTNQHREGGRMKERRQRKGEGERDRKRE